MTTSPLRPVVLRGGLVVDDPLSVVLGLVAAWRIDVSDPSEPASFGEPELRRANRDGARISAAEIAAILERRRAIERALGTIPPGASLAGTASSVPWPALRRLFDAFAGIRGVGLSKMTKALHGKRPALIPMLDSVVRAYLTSDGWQDDRGASFGERATAFVGGYKRDLDRNRAILQELQQELASGGYRLTEVRILDLLVWSVFATSGAEHG